MEREDHCRAAGRCHQHNLLSQMAQRLHHRTGQGRFARARGATEDHHALLVAVEQEACERVEGLTLVGGRCKAKYLQYLVGYLVLEHAICILFV